MKKSQIYAARNKNPSAKISRNTREQPDKGLLILIAVFLGFGLITIYDATAILAQDIYGNAYRFVIMQLAWIIVGLFGFYFFLNIKLDFLRKISVVLFTISLIFLGTLALFGVLPCSVDFIFAPCINGANRWLYINPPPLPGIPVLGILGLQPSEFAKFSLIIFLAGALEKSIKLKQEPFWTFVKVAGVVAGLIMLQPNMSTATLIFMVAATMYFVSGANLKPLFYSLPVFGLFGALVMVFSPHSRQRILTFLALNSEAEQTTGYHIKQILIALGSGGIFGVGFGQSRQKFQYLPEVFADSIFAIIGEELGFLGTSFLLILFTLLIYKGYSIAKDTPSLYGKLLAVGITTWISIQTFVNIGAMTKVIPLTGIPLPLISYGGSSLVFILMGLGVLANVSKKSA